jgi:hypothetical protein
VNGGAQARGGIHWSGAAAGGPGAVTATFNGSFTVGEACTISGSFSSP